MATIQNMIGDCNNNHTTCGPRGANSFIPTWLIELRNDHFDDRVFRLVQGKTLDSDTRYVFLSHYDGVATQSQPRFGASTRTSFCDWQQLGKLPKLFQDACEFVTQIGETYIWIDDLCGFSKGHSPMPPLAARSERSDTIRNSTLSIVALSAETDDGGLFCARDPKDVVPTVVDLCVKGPDQPEPHVFELERAWSWKLTLDRAPLTKKAYFVRDRLLAPRSLLFGPKQVYWECNEANACELHPDPSSEAMTDTRTSTKRLFKPTLDMSFFREDDKPCRQLQLDWYRIIEYYSDREVVKPSDKLTSISEIAAEVRSTLLELGSNTGQYFAGHWENTLPESLLWNARDLGHRPSTYRAPSWSWASIDALVSFHTNMACFQQSWLSEVISTSIERSDTSDELGAVDGGEIVLNGRLATATLLPQGTELLDGWKFIKSLEITGETEGDPIRAVRDQGGGMSISSWSVHFDADNDICDRFLCLPVRAQLGPDECVVTALALTRKTEGDGSISYRRIGLAEFEGRRDENTALKLFEQLPKQVIRIL